MVSKPEDTQALSKADIEEAGVKYRPRVRNTPPPQVHDNTKVQIAGIITAGVIIIAALAAFVLALLVVMGRL